MVVERYIACAEIQLRCHAESEVLAYPQFPEHTDVETDVPVVLVSAHERRHLCAVLQRKGLRPDVVELQVLYVGAHHDAEVERSKVGVRAVLHPALLRVECGCRCYYIYK